MPVARSSKPKGSNQSSTPPSKSPSRKNGAKRFTCVAWWCSSTFARPADMSKHIKSIHFGERSYCTRCNVIMKQDSNMTTHINTHSGYRCTKCSCGLEFKDPSACTRHREVEEHSVGPTYRKPRPPAPDSNIKSVRVQHRDGVELTNAKIADKNFKPPPFDDSYHCMGPKKRAEEKYDSKYYVIIEPQGVQISPSVQAPGTFPTNATGASTTEYQETAPVERLVTTQMDNVGVGTEFSYDMNFPQNLPNYLGLAESPYGQHPELPAFYPISHHQDSTYGYYTPSGSAPLVPALSTDPLPHPQQQMGNYPMAINSHFLEPSQPFAGLYEQQGYPDVLYAPQVLNPDSVLVSPPCDFFEEVGFGMPPAEQSNFYQPPFQQPQFEPLYQPGADFDYIYQPEY